MKLDDFEIGATPVMQEQYEAVMGTNPSSFKGNPNNPVEKVSWNDAMVFCEKLSKETKQKYTLPTEAQWEYACRGGHQFEYGTDDGTIDKTKANYDNNEGQTTDVKHYPVNPFGLYDMSGNVWEWCRDWYADDYYETDDAKHNPVGPKEGSRRVLRGGSWFSDARNCLSANRSRYDPSDASYSVGFRLVRRP